MMLATLAACGDGTGSVPIGDGGLYTGSGKSADFFRAYRDAFCKFYVRCGLSPSGEDCQKNLFQAGELDPSAVLQGIDNGTILYDPSKAQACWDSLLTTSCAVELWSASSINSACQPVLRGTLPPQAECAQNIECASNDCAKGPCNSSCCLGTCTALTPKGGAGSPCAQSSDCMNTAFCDYTSTGSSPPSFTCKARVGQGATCTYSLDCMVGYECVGASGSRTCEAQRKDGESCSSTGPRCAIIGSYCDPATLTCKPSLKPGQPCTVSTTQRVANSGCVSYTQCISGTCTTTPGLGEACTVPDGGLAGSSNVCRGGTCVAGTCQPLPPSACTIDKAKRADSGV